ncbi:Glycosyl transferase family 2 [Paenibacillus sp. 1_12]|uniref:glycosyltransferase family 2 protein n=1 Tax=Paenibacillus sp. 1_12 TaxID=1566278 RepID=UPI0008E45722|nr:glycosyltransferase family 2 protein [Paenibacillus sp. 1_12]SFK71887.1 Glycosyl transferase family 2 [Paenibacillus sp. 1_12]
MKKPLRKTLVRNASRPKVSIIIPVFNERKTLAGVIRQAYAIHKDCEVIVVCNGSKDGTKQLARKLGAIVIEFQEQLGHDVGRSIGAKAAKGDVILFLDGDMVIPARELRPFVEAVSNGVDVALNCYSGLTNRKEVHQVVTVKHALNAILGRSDLKGASMTTVPHAISRKALHQIDAENLAVPPKFQVIAQAAKLRMEAVHYINVLKLNPLRRKYRKLDPVGDLIVGDHLEAIYWLTLQQGERCGKTDMGRKRELVR